MNKKGSTQTNIKTRQQQVALLMTRLQAEGKQIDKITVKEELAKLKTPIVVDESTAYRDIVAVSRKNTFVVDIAQFTYSQMCENSFFNYRWIYNEARKNYEKNWNRNQIIYKKDSEGFTTEESHVTEELAEPKARFLDIMIKAQQAMDDMREGRTTKVSVALLNHEFVRVREELDNANNKLEEFATAKK